MLIIFKYAKSYQFSKICKNTKHTILYFNSKYHGTNQILNTRLPQKYTNAYCSELFNRVVNLAYCLIF